MRAVTVTTAAAAFGVDRKTIDNILARLDRDGSDRGRQGVERRIPVSALPALRLTAELMAEFRMPVRSAHALAVELLSREETLRGPVRLSVDRGALSRELDQRLSLAIESVVRRPRGRPSNASREMG